MADMTVSEVMTHLVVMLHPDDTVHGAAQRLARNHVSGAPVMEDGRVVGIVSETDLIRAASTDEGSDLSALQLLLTIAIPRPLSRAHAKRVKDVMSRAVISAGPDTSVWEAASLMTRKRVNRIPVVDEEGYLLGIVSRADLVKAMARDDRELESSVVESIEILGDETIPDLEVDVRDGVATVSGTADRRSTHDLAIKLASRTPGVVSVIDRLATGRDDLNVRLVPHQDPDPRRNWRPDATTGG